MTKKELLRMIEAKEVALEEVNEQVNLSRWPSDELHNLLDSKDTVLNDLASLEVMLDREDYEDDPDEDDEPDHILEDEECRKIEKQASQPSAPPNGRKPEGVLGRISGLRATPLGRMKVNLYGASGTGKTRLAASFPKPLLLIGAEDGTASIMGTKGVEFYQLTMGSVTEEMVELTNALATGRWKTVVLDTATKLRDMRISEIVGWQAVPEQKSWGFASREQWGQCSNNMKDMLRPLLDLPRKMDLNVVIVAQEQVYNPSEDGKAIGNDLVQVKVGSALGRSLCDWLNAECDYIAQTMIRDQAITDPESGVTTLTGKKEYALRVGAHSVYYAKFRIPEGRELKEEFLVNPSYDKIRNLIEGK